MKINISLINLDNLSYEQRKLIMNATKEYLKSYSLEFLIRSYMDHQAGVAQKIPHFVEGRSAWTLIEEEARSFAAVEVGEETAHNFRVRIKISDIEPA